MRLLLLRHAKSDWSKDADDHDRPLSDRGRGAAPEMARYMRSNNYLPEAVICSTARRTRDTLELLLGVWRKKPAIHYEPGVYLAEWPALVANLKKAPSEASPLLFVGHNPGIEQLAIALARQPEQATERSLLKRLTQKFPTAALAVLDFEIASWRSLKPGSGQLIDYVRPKDLSDSNGGDEE